MRKKTKVSLLTDMIVDYSNYKASREEALQRAKAYYDSESFRLSNLWVHSYDDLAARNIAEKLVREGSAE